MSPGKLPPKPVKHEAYNTMEISEFTDVTMSKGACDYSVPENKWFKNIITAIKTSLYIACGIIYHLHENDVIPEEYFDGFLRGSLLCLFCMMFIICMNDCLKEGKNE